MLSLIIHHSVLTTCPRSPAVRARLTFPVRDISLTSMATSAPDAVKRLVDRFDQNRDATDGSQLTAHSLRPSDSGPSAVSRKPIADAGRGIEDYGALQGIIGKPGLYRQLMERFQDADKRYDSGLFDFRKDTVRKIGTVPDCGRVRAAGGCPRFSFRAELPYPLIESPGSRRLTVPIAVI